MDRAPGPRALAPRHPRVLLGNFRFAPDGAPVSINEADHFLAQSKTSITAMPHQISAGMLIGSRIGTGDRRQEVAFEICKYEAACFRSENRKDYSRPSSGSQLCNKVETAANEAWRPLASAARCSAS